MKIPIIPVIAFLLISACDSKVKVSENENTQENEFDSTMAAEVGADEYGMRKFVLAYLKRGPNRSQDSTARANLQTAHLNNITRMAEEGKLVLAGPFMDDGDIRGIYIFAVESIEEAEELTKTDPAIQAGSLIMELHEWYGSAALMKIGELHKKIAKIYI